MYSRFLETLVQFCGGFANRGQNLSKVTYKLFTASVTLSKPTLLTDLIRAPSRRIFKELRRAE